MLLKGLSLYFNFVSFLRRCSMISRPLVYVTLTLLCGLLLSSSCNGQDEVQKRQSLLNETYYIAGLESGFYATYAGHQAKKASGKTTGSLSAELVAISKMLPSKQKCINRGKTLMPKPNGLPVSDYLRKLSTNQKTDVAKLLRSAALSFDKYDQTRAELCWLEEQICSNVVCKCYTVENLKRELGSRKAAFGAFIHETVPAFQLLTKRWSKEKALFRCVQMNDFKWDHFTKQMARKVTTWSLEARTVFRERAPESMLQWFELYCIHASTCSDLYTGSELAITEKEEVQIVLSNKEYYKVFYTISPDHFLLSMPKCLRKKKMVARKKSVKSKTAVKPQPRITQQAEQSFVPAPPTVPNVVQNPSNWVPGILVQPNWSQPKWTVPSFVPPQSTVIQSVPSAVAPKKAFW